MNLTDMASDIEVLEKKLKETNRIDMDDDIEDAEFIIENYENNFGV